MRTEFENRIYSRAELREREIDTNDFTFMDEVGEVEGTLCLKAAARDRMLRLFFVLSDGRKILTPVFWWRYRLHYAPGKDGFVKLVSAVSLGGE